MPKNKQHPSKRVMRLPKHPAKQRAVLDDQRRRRVAELLLQGKTYREMAEAVSESTQTISDDVKAIVAEWQRQQQHALTEWKALELERIGRIEAQAWEAWERSQEDAKVHKRKVVDEVEEVTDVVKVQVGDPRFLDTVMKCVAQRSELLGLDEPEKMNVPELLTPEELEKRRKERWEKVLPALAIVLSQQAKERESDVRQIALFSDDKDIATSSDVENRGPRDRLRGIATP